MKKCLTSTLSLLLSSSLVVVSGCTSTAHPATEHADVSGRTFPLAAVGAPCEVSGAIAGKESHVGYLICREDGKWTDVGSTRISPHSLLLIDLNKVHGDYSMSLGSLVVRDQEPASVSAYSQYLPNRAHVDGAALSAAESQKNREQDFAESWQVTVRNVVVDLTGNVSMIVTVDEQRKGLEESHKAVSLYFDSRTRHATVHGSHGEDYLITIRSLAALDSPLT